MQRRQFLTEFTYATLYFSYCLFRGMPVTADIVAQLFLVDTGNPFQSGQRKRIRIVLKERCDIILGFYHTAKIAVLLSFTKFFLKIGILSVKN